MNEYHVIQVWERKVIDVITAPSDSEAVVEFDRLRKIKGGYLQLEKLTADDGNLLKVPVKLVMSDDLEAQTRIHGMIGRVMSVFADAPMMSLERLFENDKPKKRRRRKKAK